MIHSLSIKNIQSHKNSFLEFDPGVNVVIGGSDNGKSAIFNSLYWVMYNRPLGDEHKSWESLGWGDSMSAEVELQEGISIKLERDKQSIYTIDPNNGDEPLTFKAFGQEPPTEVTQIFNLDRKINIQQQLEKGVPIFLISESPGDVAKHFNQVAGLYKIDTTIDTGKKEVNLANKNLKIVNTQIKDKIKELKSYKGLNELNELIIKAQELENQIKNDIELKDKLINNIKQIDEINANLKIKKEKLLLFPLINQALILYNSIKEQESWVENKQQLIKNIKRKQDKLKILNKKIELKPIVEKAFCIFKMGLEYTKKKDALKQKINAILTTKDKIKRLSTRKEETSVKFKDLMPSECPLCGR